MPVDFLASPRELRSQLKRLADSAERIDLFVSCFDDDWLAQLLARAARRGAEVHVTTNLAERTSPDAVAKMIRAGVSVGEISPRRFGRRAITGFNPRLYLFDNESAFWTAAIIGSADATSDALALRSPSLEAAVLCESDTFDGSDEAGELLIKVLDYADTIGHAPVDETLLESHRQQWEASHGDAGGASHVPGFVSPLSWQQLRRCDWATYWRGLLEAERRRSQQTEETLTGPEGWLMGVDMARAAFDAGPDSWMTAQPDLMGASMPSAWLGAVDDADLARLINEDEGFRRELHEAVQRCAVVRSGATLRHAMAPLLLREGVTMVALSRILAAAAPDRYMSIVEPAVRDRLADIVGFDLAPEDADQIEHLQRYANAVEQIHRFPWAAANSAERSTEHPDEADAWSKRVALLGCFVG